MWESLQNIIKVSHGRRHHPTKSKIRMPKLETNYRSVSGYQEIRMQETRAPGYQEIVKKEEISNPDFLIPDAHYLVT